MTPRPPFTPPIITDSKQLQFAPAQQAKHFRIAWWLALATIGYNLLEGAFCTIFGYQDDSTTLFGFGLDSFIECISGLGIAHMVWLSRNHPAEHRDNFEKTALKITGAAFYVLAVGLVITTAWNLWNRVRPETTIWGIVVALISLSVMWAMIWQKEKTGRILHSEAMLADAQCARVCMWMSVILLVSSAVYTLTGFAYSDALGTLGLVIFSIREGKECFEKAAGQLHCSCH